MNKFLKLLLASLCSTGVFAAAAAWGATTNVNMIGNRFVPPDLRISFGDTVTWTNLDNTRHDTVSGANGIPSPGWNSPLFGIRGSYSFTFTNTPLGVKIPYYCTPHWRIGMIGSITVLPPNSPPTVSIDFPVNGAIVAADLPLVVLASAADSDGNVIRVDFFADGNPIGSDVSSPYSATFANPSSGNHVLSAVAVDNRGGTSATAIVNLTAIEPPGIDVQPSDQSLNEGDSAVFAVIASGAPPISFQWRFNGSDVAGATNNTFTVNPVTTNDVGEYEVVVSNPASSVTSRPASLSVIPLPVVTLTSPSNGTRYPVGVPVVVTADATNANGIGVRVEFLNNNVVVGLVSNAPFGIVLSNLSAGTYELAAQAFNDLGGKSTSESVQISMHDPPLISIVYPTNRSVFPTNAVVRVTNVVSSAGTTVTNVQFFANDFLIAEGAFPFVFDWRPTLAGVYVLIAIATDDLGQRASSMPLTNRIFIPENGLPTITITGSPPNFDRRTPGMVTLSGTASDDIGLDHVEFQVNHGPFLERIGAVQLADGTTNWTAADIALFPGANSVLVRSVDLAGNVSFDEARFFTHVVTGSLTVRTEGTGTVTPDLTQRPLEIGQVYTVKAVPEAGFVFDEWDFGGVGGVGSSNNATLSFVMQSNLVLTAKFILSPFSTANGIYTGLFYDPDSIEPESSGFFTLQVGSRGTFRGKLMMNGSRYSYRGHFNTERQATLPVLRRKLPPLVLHLELDPTDPAGQISGSVSVLVSHSITNNNNGMIRVVQTNTLRTVELLGYRNLFQSRSHPVTQAGLHPFRFEQEDGLPVGTNLAKISTAGQVRIRGSLSDGRKFTMGTSLAMNGDCPLYLSLSNGSEVIIGWLNFPTNALPSVDGNFSWIKSGANGFSFQVEAVTGQR